MGKYTATVEDHLVVPARVLQTLEQEQVFRLAQRPVPASVAVRLLIDTGSKRTMLVPGVVRHLQLPAGSSVRVETSLVHGETTLFWVRLEFPQTSLAPIPELAVVRLSMPPSLATFHGVIGRDLLSRWESLLYEGRLGRFTVRDATRGLRAWFRR